MQPGIIAASREMRHVIDQIDAVAPFQISVFLSGESGTGKELAARRLHAKSPRARSAFVPVNCAALPDGLLEAELFGHTRGAFTGAQQSREGLLERADGGTLFLDEVADLPSRAQTALLRALQEKEYRRLGDTTIRRSNFRLVSASHKNLDAEVAAGRFRHDLLFRLRVVHIEIPPLRERVADIVPLARHCILAQSRALGLAPRALSRDAEKRISAYSWPGNVRELENEIVRALLQARDTSTVLEKHLSPHVCGDTRRRLRSASRDLERKLLEDALATNGGNRTRAARTLGLSRQGLYRKLKRLGMMTAAQWQGAEKL